MRKLAFFGMNLSLALVAGPALAEVVIPPSTATVFFAAPTELYFAGSQLHFSAASACNAMYTPRLREMGEQINCIYKNLKLEKREGLNYCGADYVFINRVTGANAGSGTTLQRIDTAILCPRAFVYNPDKKACQIEYPDAENCSNHTPNMCRGNPINVARGNRANREVDYVFNGLPVGRQFSSWHLGGTPQGLLGKSWFLFPFERKLNFITENGVNYAYAIREMGRSDLFSQVGGNWVAARSLADRLEAVGNAGTVAWRHYSASDSSIEEYDAAGRLLAIVMRGGLRFTLHYSDANTPADQAPAAGLLTKVTNPWGRSLQFEYRADGRVIGLIDPAGNRYRYGYGESWSAAELPEDQLTSLRAPDGAVRKYHYEFNRESKIRATLAAADGAWTTSQLIGPDSPFNPNTFMWVTTPSDQPMNEDSASARNAIVAAMTRGHAGNPLTGITDENNSRISKYGYTLDGISNSTEQGNGAEKYTVAVSPKATSYFSTAEGPNGELLELSLQVINGQVVPTSEKVSCTGCSAATTTYYYDTRGNLVKKRDPNSNISEFRYNERNLEVLRVDGVTGTSNGVPVGMRSTATEWHPTFSLPAKITESVLVGGVAGNKVTEFSYDAAGNVLKKTVTAPKVGGGTEARTWTYTYNLHGQLLSIDGPRGDVADTTTYEYDAQGNLIKTTDPLGHVTTYADYDAHGRAGKITDPNGLVTTVIYDLRGRVLTRTVGSETTTYGYDSAGQLIKVTQPDGSWLSYSYDTAHRLTGLTDSDGNRLVYTLDAQGNRVKEEAFDPTGQLARVRSRVYDGLKRLKQEINGQ